MISYLITDPAYYGTKAWRIQVKFLRVVQKHQVDIALFRDKRSKNIRPFALALLRTAKAKGVKLFINQDIELFRRFAFDGLHLTSRQFHKIKRVRSMGSVVISTHRVDELKMARKLRVKAATFSPIFYTPNKGKPKGVYTLAKLPKNMKIIALGGITSKKHIHKIARYNLYGFASIRYFV